MGPIIVLNPLLCFFLSQSFWLFPGPTGIYLSFSLSISCDVSLPYLVIPRPEEQTKQNKRKYTSFTFTRPSPLFFYFTIFSWRTKCPYTCYLLIKGKFYRSPFTTNILLSSRLITVLHFNYFANPNWPKFPLYFSISPFLYRPLIRYFLVSIMSYYTRIHKSPPGYWFTQSIPSLFSIVLTHHRTWWK